MSLRALKHLPLSVMIIIGFLYPRNQFAARIHPSKIVGNIPYEIKFADVTFQLSEVTRYLVQNEVEALLSDHKRIEQRMEKFALFLPVVEPMLKEADIPGDFKFLMLYDKFQQANNLSVNLEPDVLWCLNKEVATEVDLKVNATIDERKHIESATKAGVECIKRNYSQFNNWAMVLFAHIADKKVVNNYDISHRWSASSLIQLDSPIYAPILQFLALKLSIEQEFPGYRPLVPKVLYEYPYGKGKTLQKIATELKVDLPSLIANNPWFTTATVPEGDEKVLVVTSADKFTETKILAELTQKSALPTKDLGFPMLKRNLSFNRERGGVFYEINHLLGLQADLCDNAVTMAYKADISIKKFLEFNDLNEKDVLHVGSVYYLEKKENKANVPFHIVREGETLWDISQDYGLKLEKLLEYNRLEKVQRLQRGRVVWMQTTRPKDKPVEYIQMSEELPLNELASNDTNETVKQDEEKPSVTVMPAKTEMASITSTVGTVVPKEEEKIKAPEPQIVSIPTVIASVKDSVKANLAVKTNEPATTKTVTKTNDGWGDSKFIVIGQAKTSPKKSEMNYSEEVARRVMNQSSTSYEDNFVYHTVKKDETLYRISVNYNVSVENLWKLNNLTSNIIEIGTKLKVKKQ